MRPRKLDYYEAYVVLRLFDQFKADLKRVGRYNQYQIAERLIQAAHDAYHFGYTYNRKNPLERPAETATPSSVSITYEMQKTCIKFYKTKHYDYIENYLIQTTPAALVQMVKRLKKERAW